MRRVSKKTAKRNAEYRVFREALIAEVGRCEKCGHDPDRPRHGEAGPLCVHHICRGGLRDKGLTARCAVLVLCWPCHVDGIVGVHGNDDWPEARQLAILKRSRPKDYSLQAYNLLLGYGPYRITEEDVGKWL